MPCPYILRTLNTLDLNLIEDKPSTSDNATNLEEETSIHMKESG